MTFITLLKRLWLVWLLLAVMVVSLIVGNQYGAYYACHSRWEGSARTVSFSPVSGCRVSVEATDGNKMVPESNVTIIEQPKAGPINGDKK